MIVLSGYTVLSAAEAEYLENPIIGWHSLVNIDNVSADYADADYPIVNVANSSTASKWRSSSALAQTIEVLLASEEALPADYVAIAGHNFGTARVSVSFQAFIDGEWETIINPFVPKDDAVIMLRFAKRELGNVRLALGAGIAVPEIAVLYVGELLVFERSLKPDADYLPPIFGTKKIFSDGRSEAGDLLGRVQLGQYAVANGEFEHLDYEWSETKLKKFLDVSGTTPFFFAWDPVLKPKDVGYGLLDNDPLPTVDPVTGLVSLKLQMSGVSR